MIDKVMEEIFTGVVTVLNDGHSGVAPYKNYDEIRTILEKHLGLLESKMEPLGEVLRTIAAREDACSCRDRMDGEECDWCLCVKSLSILRKE